MKKVGIICAVEDELQPFLQHIEDDVITEKSMLGFHEGKINGIPVVALYCGVCKVNAALATQILIDTFSVDVIINSGTAGGIDKSLKLFDTIISTQVAYHDVEEWILRDYHPRLTSIYFNADESLLNIAKRISEKFDNVHFGRMVTGEQFIEGNMHDSIREKFSPLSADMETASIAHVCYVNKIPYISVRTLTDTPSQSGLENFEENVKQASIVSKDIVLAFLRELKK